MPRIALTITWLRMFDSALDVLVPAPCAEGVPPEGFPSPTDRDHQRPFRDRLLALQSLVKRIESSTRDLVELLTQLCPELFETRPPGAVSSDDDVGEKEGEKDACLREDGVLSVTLRAASGLVGDVVARVAMRLRGECSTEMTLAVVEKALGGCPGHRGCLAAQRDLLAGAGRWEVRYQREVRN